MAEKKEHKIRIVILGLLGVFGVFPLIFAFAAEFAKYAERRSKKRRLALAMRNFAAQVILFPKGSLSTPWEIKNS